jgi:hypothetical protein
MKLFDQVAFTAPPVDKPGIYDAMPMANYVADPCPKPSANKGSLHLIVTKTPMHAHYYHPRLGGNAEKVSAAANLGSAAHSILLGGPEIVTVEADNWQTKAAREARDEALEAGKIPLLAEDCGNAFLMADAAQKALTGIVNPLADGNTEQTIIWQEDGHWCRGRFDWLSNDRELAIDYKTTTNAEPGAWIRKALVPFGYDLQVAHYKRGIEALTFKIPRFLFLVQEKEPPYACSICELGERHLDLARRKWKFAMRVWKECNESKNWPGYNGVYVTEPPAYDEYAFADKLITEEI